MFYEKFQTSKIGKEIYMLNSYKCSCPDCYIRYNLLSGKTLGTCYGIDFYT